MDINFINICINISIGVATLIVAYLFGSIPSGVIIGKLLMHEDPREHGSKNAGGTNASRIWGFKIGVLVYIFDFLKLAIPLWGTWALYVFVNFNGKTICPSYYEIINNQFSNHYILWPADWLVIIGVVIGHCYPIFASFKGGKAAACTFSTAFFSSWFVALIGIGTFTLTLKAKKYVSLASIIGSIATSIASWLVLIPGLNQVAMYGPTLAPHWLFGVVVTLSSMLLIFRHRTNIKRIIDKTERKIHWM